MTESFTGWVRNFEDEARRRRNTPDPDWDGGATLFPEVTRSVQRFQVGESGDGVNLMAKADADGDGEYSTAVRLFVAEEQNHARLLGLLLHASGAPTIAKHWSDTIFVRLRRALGLRLELMVLMLAEVVALSYYRALRDGSDDPLTSDVAGRILADERRHVPFHCQRLHAAFARMPRPARPLVTWGWWLLMAGAALLVAVDHGSALRRLSVPRWRFVIDTLSYFKSVVAEVRGWPRVPSRAAAALRRVRASLARAH